MLYLFSCLTILVSAWLQWVMRVLMGSVVSMLDLSLGDAHASIFKSFLSGCLYSQLRPLLVPAQNLTHKGEKMFGIFTVMVQTLLSLSLFKCSPICLPALRSAILAFLEDTSPAFYWVRNSWKKNTRICFLNRLSAIFSLFFFKKRFYLFIFR